MTDKKYEDQRTIVVSNLPTGLTEDELVIHFQSRKNRGGDVEKVDLSQDGSQAFVSFELADVVEDVLRVEQIIKGRPVQVHRYKTEEKNDEKSSSDDIDTVVVSGFSENTTDETITLLFEHKKKSGGGELKEFQRLTPKEAFITFCSAKDAEDVLKKSSELCLDGHSLTVKPWKGRASDKSMLIIENLNPSTAYDTLKNYIEMMANQDVINIVFGENNNAIANLSGDADGECIKKASERTLEGSNVRINFAPPTFAVRITMLPPSFSEDAILCKFENPRYGGGEASDKTFNKEKREAIIFFKDPAVVSSLVKKKHELSGVELSVSPYYEWFEEALNGGKKMEEYCGEMPISRDIVNFIEAHHDIQKKFDLKSFSIDGNKEMLKFCKEFVDSSEMESLKCKLKDFLDSFVKDSITGFKDISDKLKEIIDERPEDFRNDLCCLIFDEAQVEIVLTGEKQEVAAKKESIMRKINELREKSIKEIETFPVEDKNKLQFLNSIGYPRKVQTVFPGSEVIVESSSGKIILLASRAIINDLRTKISRDIMGIVTTNFQMSDRQIEFLKRTECKLVNEEFKKTGTSAQLSLVPAKAAKARKEVHLAQLMLLKNTGDKTEELDHVVYKMISEKCLKVDSTTGSFLTQSAKWRDFQNQLFEKSRVMVEHKTTEPEKIWIVGEESIANKALEEARGYTTSTTITSSIVTIDENRARYLTSYRMKDISDLNKRFPEEGVQVEYSNAGHFKITGTASGITKATEVLQSYSKEIASKFYEINGPGMKKQLQMDTTVALIAGIERENKCIIQRNASAEDANADAIVLSNGDDFEFVSDTEIRTKSGQKLSIVVGDISKQKVDVIVNTTNEKLDLNANPCAKALLKVAGKELTEECQKKGDLKIGEVASTKPGDLDCKQVYHVFCAAWADGKGEPILSKIVKDCLTKVQDDKLTSIAIPAIGTGNHKFPHATVANIFFEETSKFLADNPQTTVNDIRFVLYDKDQPSIDGFKNTFKAKKPKDKIEEEARKDEAKPVPGGLVTKVGGFMNAVKAIPSSFTLHEGRKDGEARIKEDKPVPRAVPVSGNDFEVINDKQLRTKSGQMLSIVIGDLSNQKVDVIVNTTNDKLDLNANPCAKALLKVAGKELTEECQKKGDLKIGEVASTKSGDLDCKQVYHVFCAAWADGKGEPILSKIVKDCLTKVQDDKLTSIAIPAIGTGNHKFPHATVADIFYKETLKFLADNPQTTVNDIRFVVYDKDQSSIDGFMNTLKAMKSSTSVVTPEEKGKYSDHRKLGGFQTNENADGNLDVFLGKNLTVQIVNGDITKESTEMIMHVTNIQLSLNGGVAKSLKAAGGDVFEEECKAASPIPLSSVKLTGAGNLLVPQVAHVAAPDRPTSQDLEKCLETFFDFISKTKVQKISLSAIGAGAIGLSEKESAEVILSTLCRVHQTGVSITLSLVRIIIFEKQKFKNFKSAVKKLSTFSTRFHKIPQDSQLCVRIYAEKTTVIEKAWKKLKEKLETQIQKASVKVDVEQLSMEEVRMIEDIGKDYDVMVRVNKKDGRVEFRGHSTDVIAVQKLFTTYNEIMELKKKGSPLPSHWDKQPAEKGNEVPFHEVKLKSSSSEYEKVAKEFLKTAITQKIVKITRIQNPPMFRSYIARKDEKSGIDEKYLFHGTKAENVDAINREGFNRSFAGINGTVFGRGVYFARDASYSCQDKFAPLDAQNHQYIYYARVLVGEYTKGSVDMIVPPVKGDLNDPNAKFDCTVNDVNNPSIFVLFLDREHYPEYLIISKK